MTIRSECVEKGTKLLNAREILQMAGDFAAHAKYPNDIVSSGIAEEMIYQAKEFERDAELSKEEGMRIEVSLAGALDSINKADYDTAISYIIKARKELLDLMFQTVVACECGESSPESLGYHGGGRKNGYP